MAEELIAFPFRLTRQGKVAGVRYGSDEEVEQAIAVATMTEIGERLMFPNFGIPNPAFDGLHADAIQACLNQYGPADVTITTIDEQPVTDLESIATINWEREDTTEPEDEDL